MRSPAAPGRGAGGVLHSCHMGNTLTIRLTEGLRRWLKETSRKTGLPVGRIIREQLERAKAEANDDSRPWMRLAGSIKGLPRDLSSRKGFSRR